jgi:hypothetical protein
MNDPIVEEVRKVRDTHTAAFNYDMDAIFRDIKQREKKSGCVFVAFPPRKTEPNRTFEQTGAGLVEQMTVE